MSTINPRSSFSVIADLLQSKGRDAAEVDEELDQPRGSALTPAQVAETAAAIVKAGAQRRGELEIPITAPPQPRQTPLTPAEVRSTAAAILAAGRKARSPT